MEKTITALLDIFKHATRDLLFYGISGFIVLLNIVLIDYAVNGSILISMLQPIPCIEVVTTVVAFVVGHFIMGLMYVCIELTTIEKRYATLFNIKLDADLKKEISILKTDKAIYDGFVERYNTIAYFRWSLAGSFLMSTILWLSSFFWAEFAKNCTIIYWSAAINFIVFWIFLILHYVSQDHFVNRVDEAYNIITTKN